MDCRLTKRKLNLPTDPQMSVDLIQHSTLLLHIKHGVENFPTATNEDENIARAPHFIVPFRQDPDFITRPDI